MEASLEVARHKALNDVGCAVGRTVFDDQNVKLIFKRHNRTDDGFNIFLFVVRRDDNNALSWFHVFYNLD